MHLGSNVSNALQQIESIKTMIDEYDDNILEVNTTENLKIILDVLEDPVFRAIIQIQNSLSDLNVQFVQHPSMLPHDFDIDVLGNLILNVPHPVEIYDAEYPDEQRVPSAQLSPKSPISPIVDSISLLSTECNGQSFAKDQGLVNKFRVYPEALHNFDDECLQSVVNDISKHSDDFVSSDWTLIQAINLVNDGSGLGFGIIGARNSGVIVKTILPGGVADRDGRLQSGDHILQIGNVNLHDMVSEQVASVLRQSGTHVRLVVARPIDKLSHKYKLNSICAIVPSRIVMERIELEKHLIATGYSEIFSNNSTPSTPSQSFDNKFSFGEVDIPETEKFQVKLTKDVNGLGITIAGYVCEKEELSGIFVKSISSGSAADLSGQIRINDRIIEVDGQNLQGFSNHQAVEVLRKSGTIVTLCLERYLRGPKYDKLQQAIAANEISQPVISNTSTKDLLSITTVPQYKCSGVTVNLFEDRKNSEVQINDTFATDNKKLFNSKDSLELPSVNTVDSSSLLDLKVDKKKVLSEVSYARNSAVMPEHKYCIEPEITPEMEINIIKKWQQIVGQDVKIIVAQLKKFAASSGLGISLEGTVDVEDGREVRPHHYIRSVLPEGPVGQNGLLKSGDELLEVNGQRLLGMNHLEVVAVLKELPQDVRMVCGRGKGDMVVVGEDSVKNNVFGRSQNLESSIPISDRLVKAKSDGSLATTGSVSDDTFPKLKSRSLEPLTGLAMWSSEPQIIELVKGERGLGFSILDYQDPLDPNDTLIVIRSLVPGGVAQLDGRLIPGDRLLFVNDINLENASLDQAVQALKGASKGIVRIGVAKPLPLTDACVNLSSSEKVSSFKGISDVTHE